MLNKSLTKYLFSSYDALKGGRLTSLYEEIKAQNDSGMSFDLQKLSAYLQKWGLDKDIQKLPISTKEDIRKFNSQLPQEKISSYVYTGGSTGNPLRLPYSKNRELIRTASITYYNRLAGYEIGDPFLFIRAKQKPKLLQFLRNETLFIPTDISPEKIEDISKKIVHKRLSVLIGYPTVIYEISSFFSSHQKLRKRLSVKSIITVSEPLDDLRRAFIKEVFGCKLIDRYSNEEVGVMGQQREFGGEYIVDKFGVFVEVIDPETLKAVAENEIGKVVVTDVYNDLIPVVRYDTGDYAMVSKYENNQLYGIKKIVGRTAEQIYTTDGIPVSPLTLGPYIYKPFSESNITCQFQFVQIATRQYQFRIKGKDSDSFSRIVKTITEGLMKILGADADIETIFLPEIRPLPSGKRPLYRNEMTTNSEEK